MSDDALLATMTELTTYLTLRRQHRDNIQAAQDALNKLEDKIAWLRATLASHLHDYAVGDQPIPALAAAEPAARVTPSERARKAGLAAAASLTPEQRSERARKGSAARWGKANEPPATANLINVFSGETKQKGGRPKGSKDKQPRKTDGYRSSRGPRPVREIASAPALEALETIKASGPEGVPADKLHTKPWVMGLLARAGKARKVNGNWVAA